MTGGHSGGGGWGLGRVCRPWRRYEARRRNRSQGRPRCPRQGRRSGRPARREAGFTLVEMLVALLLLVLALALAAQLLGETQQMMADATRQALDPAAAQVAMRLRTDVLGATGAMAVPNPDGSCALLELLGSPEGTIAYVLTQGSLTRTVVGGGGIVLGSSPLLPNAVAWSCAVLSEGTAQVVLLDYRYVRSRARRSPLPLLPGMWGPRQEQVHESLVLVPRGGGLGGAWW
jgi:prepilin-type N-terminal cleavage/methylation domain-containing protein